MENFKVEKRFNIEKTAEVLRIIDKYSFCDETYALDDYEAEAFKCMRFLSEYERVLFYAICELKSSRKVATLFGTNPSYASKSIKEVKCKISYIAEILKGSGDSSMETKDDLLKHIKQLSVEESKKNIMRQQKAAVYKSQSGEMKDCVIIDHNGKDIFVAPINDLFNHKK